METTITNATTIEEKKIAVATLQKKIGDMQTDVSILKKQLPALKAEIKKLKTEWEKTIYGTFDDLPDFETFLNFKKKNKKFGKLDFKLKLLRDEENNICRQIDKYNEEIMFAEIAVLCVPKSWRA